MALKWSFQSVLILLMIPALNVWRDSHHLYCWWGSGQYSHLRGVYVHIDKDSSTIGSDTLKVIVFIHNFCLSQLWCVYIFTGPPPAPIIDSISLGEDNSTFYTFNVSWNPLFTTTNAITFYVISPPTSTTEGQDIDLAVSCPFSCSPDVPCQCSGLS